MDSENSFLKGERYAAYCKHTNEKDFLRKHVKNAYVNGELLISPFSRKIGRVLDLGCGTGENLRWMLDVFSRHHVEGIDRSKQQLNVIKEEDSPVRHVNFEDFASKKYDFILVSHVLQYIDTDATSFISKVYESLNYNGQAWFVQQTTVGMYEVISSVKEHLNQSRFSNWSSFSDYVRLVDEMGLCYNTYILDSSFTGINFSFPNYEDKLRLEFMLGLDRGFDDPVYSDLRRELSVLPSNPIISHPNGILKVLRC